MSTEPTAPPIPAALPPQPSPGEQALGTIAQIEATAAQAMQMDTTLAKVIDLTLALVSVQQSLGALRRQVQMLTTAPEAPAADATKSAESSDAGPAAEPRPASRNGAVESATLS